MKIGKKISANKDIPFKRRLLQFYNRFIAVFKLALILIIAILIITRQFSSITFDIRNKIAEYFAEIGFVLDHVVISGQKNTSNYEIIEALNADTGTPIFSIDLSKTSIELLKNPWVKSVIVQRKLPDTIQISLYEKDPISIWQMKQELYVIDADGDIISGAKAENFPNLIHLVGEDANIYAYEFVHAVSSDAELAGKIQYAIRYGQRRWDINLIENINVKMPQYEFDEAYNYLLRLYKKGELFNKKIKTIDLRDMKKIYIEKLK